MEHVTQSDEDIPDDKLIEIPPMDLVTIWDPRRKESDPAYTCRVRHKPTGLELVDSSETTDGLRESLERKMRVILTKLRRDS